MPVITVDRHISAPADLVFRAISDIENLPQTAPQIRSIEFLSERRAGIGTRYRETRDQNGQSMVFELEVTEFDPDARTIRIASDTDGTMWDTLITVEPANVGSHVTFAMDARGHSWIRQVLNILLQRTFRK